MKLVNLSDILSPRYDINEANSCEPCIICGKDVSKIEEKCSSMWNAIANKDPKALKWYKNNYIHLDTDGNLYYTDEDVAEGHESQGCFAIGCCCMKKYKEYRMRLG